MGVVLLNGVFVEWAEGVDGLGGVCGGLGEI